MLAARRYRGPLAAFSFSAGTLFPVLGFLNVYPFRYSYVADHFQYLASLGIIVPVTSVLVRASERLSSGKAVTIACLRRADPGSWRTDLAAKPYVSRYRDPLPRIAGTQSGQLAWRTTTWEFCWPRCRAGFRTRSRSTRRRCGSDRIMRKRTTIWEMRLSQTTGTTPRGHRGVPGGAADQAGLCRRRTMNLGIALSSDCRDGCRKPSRSTRRRYKI